MNLLFDFLKNLTEQERPVLKNLKTRGAMEGAWLELNAQARAGHFDKDKILKELDISPSHFDKITSELLTKSYQLLFPEGGLNLLRFLSYRIDYVKHFYTELKRQLKRAEIEYNANHLISFYKACIELHFVNIPIAYRDMEALEYVAARYQAIFKKRPDKKLGDLWIGCKLIDARVQVEFAADRIKLKEAEFRKKIEALGKLPAAADEQLVYEYYWTRIYFEHAIEKFAATLDITNQALEALSKFKTKENATNMLRIRLKQSELLYYLNRFEESFANFEEVVNSPLIEGIPDRGYYITKYVQVCLITEHVANAGTLLMSKQKALGDQFPQALAPRDVFSFIKYYLFNKQYEEAFEFIRLGFEKNPKGKYFQYEVELRNLETACFFLTGQMETAIQMCDKHIKYLRFHGHKVRDSNYPYFYVLTKAIYEVNRGIRKFTPKEKEKFERYQLGSYALYGRLLLKMLSPHAKPF